MELYSGYINKLIEELSSLPGIGEKSAARLAFHSSEERSPRKQGKEGTHNHHGKVGGTRAARPSGTGSTWRAHSRM